VRVARAVTPSGDSTGDAESCSTSPLTDLRHPIRIAPAYWSAKPTGSSESPQSPRVVDRMDGIAVGAPDCLFTGTTGFAGCGSIPPRAAATSGSGPAGPSR
jgi:hypothetical protein